MCGIAALIRWSEKPIDCSVIETMTDVVRHRGPDGFGITRLALRPAGVCESDNMHSADWHVALGHRRLSILDLSEAGRQPMCYRGRHWITYNGEIYNYVELRAELERLGHQFQSQSDTEVILAAYDQWGTACFDRFHGMWGLVLVDGRQKIAVLSRDRLGIKPLYLVETAEWVAVASEIKQFQSLPGFQLKADEGVVRDYLLTGYERQKSTFFRAVTPIPAGTWQSLDLTTGALASPESYWFPERVNASLRNRGEAAKLLRNALEQSVRIHMRSDVPVGCALSGGLDSSAIAGCISQLENGSPHPLKTFSVAFPGCAVDEQVYARRVVDFVKSSAYYVTPTAEQFIEDLDRFIWTHDEPVGSLSQYNGYALARLTRGAGVPVTLNGQGGDEILGGYWQSYFMHLRHLVRSGRLLEFCYQFAGACLPRGNRELPRQLPVMWRRYQARRSGVIRGNVEAEFNQQESARATLEQLMAMNDQQRRVYEIRQLHLPRLLKWDDRNFMAFSVEGRYPFLDHRLIELCLSFSPSVLYRRGWTKEPLRRGLEGLLPASILRRRSKIGFEVPQGQWLVGPLSALIDRFLNGDSPVWKLFDPYAARAVAERVQRSNGRVREDHEELFRLFLADRWMRKFQLA